MTHGPDENGLSPGYKMAKHRRVSRQKRTKNRKRSRKIRKLIHEGYPDGHGQAGAIAYSMQRRGEI